VRLIDNERAFFSDRKSFHFPSGMAADGVVTPSGIGLSNSFLPKSCPSEGVNLSHSDLRIW